MSVIAHSDDWIDGYATGQADAAKMTSLAEPYPHTLLHDGRWYVDADTHTGAVKELRALFEEADYQAQRDYPTPERFREALLRADAWLTANGGQ